MGDSLDLEQAAAIIADCQDLVALKTPLQSDREVLDFEGKSALIEGDLDRDVLIKGERSLLVRGSVVGQSRLTNRLEVDGDVVVTGGLANTQVSGNDILVGGDVARSSVLAAGDFCAGGNMKESHVVIGDYQIFKRDLEELNREHQKLQTELEQLQRQLGVEKRRMDKACSVTRDPLDFSVGSVVRHESGRIRIDLESFYQSISEHQQANVDRALKEFFAKGIVGIVARSNQKYLSNNPAREKIFMQLLRQLRDLILLVHQNEMVNSRLVQVEENLGQKLAHLNNRAGILEIGGALGIANHLEFVQARAVHVPGNSIEFNERIASMQVAEGENDRLKIALLPLEGNTSHKLPTQSEMAALRFRLEDGSVVWSALSGSN